MTAPEYLDSDYLHSTDTGNPNETATAYMTSDGENITLNLMYDNGGTEEYSYTWIRDDWMELSDGQIAEIETELSVPDSSDITVDQGGYFMRPQVDPPVYLNHIEFTTSDGGMAGAHVNMFTGELENEIFQYSIQ